uniref:Uncharacterized protein n=1 Tax=Octopus bimaculoides TaxID=37653 RepID=A0A0L8I6S2_OCTBM
MSFLIYPIHSMFKTYKPIYRTFYVTGDSFSALSRRTKFSLVKPSKTLNQPLPSTLLTIHPRLSKQQNKQRNKEVK